MLDRTLQRAVKLLASQMVLLAAGYTQSAAIPQAAAHVNIASLEKLAEAGDPEAQTKLGLAYHNGDGVTADDWKAADWLRRAADQGDGVAQNSLGILYQSGHGVPKDLAQAFAWFRKSASQRYGPGVFNVATSYYNGDGIPEDMVTAYAWMLMADELGEKDAHDAVARTAKELAGRATEGEYTLAEILDAGIEVPKNEAGAARWYRLAGDHGSVDAQVKYGLMLADGRGIARNPAEAFPWLERAAKQKSGPAMFTLGYAYQKGTLGQQIDVKKAITWYEGAAAAGHAGAMVNLGMMNTDGTAGPPNYQKAYFWFYMADSFNMPQAKLGMAAVTPHLSQKQIADTDNEASVWWRLNGRAIAIRRAPTMDQNAAESGPKGPSGSDPSPNLFKVGGDVIAPRAIFSPEPGFGPNRPTSGTVVLRCVVRTDGSTGNIEVVESGTPDLDKQAIAALKTWRFSPATRKGEPVPVVITVNFNFKVFGKIN